MLTDLCPKSRILSRVFGGPKKDFCQMFGLTDEAGKVFGRMIHCKTPISEKPVSLPVDDTVLVCVSSVSYILPFCISIVCIS